MSAAARSLARVAAMVAAVGVTAASAQASVTVIVVERPAPTVTLRPAGAATVDADSVVTVAGSQPVELEVVLDTKLSTLEGYRYALRWSGGALSALGLEHVEGAVAPLEPDAFGPFEIDEPARAIRNVNAASLEPGPGRAAGVHVIERLSFVVDELPEEGIEVSAFLAPGDTFGLDEATGTPTFFGVRLVPEPVQALGHAAAALALAALGRRRARRASALGGCPQRAGRVACS